MNKRAFFFKINRITIGAVFVLILVGSIVRSKGAGMGCPDWPKCFGSYIPPTSSEQLPENYRDIYKEKRLKKNERLSDVLVKIGYSALADRIVYDPDVHRESEFDVIKTWIEYVNRLVGVVIGFLVILNMIYAFSVGNGSISIMGILVFLLTVFQGWIGSLVVSSHLLKEFISVHMFLALVMINMLIWMQVRGRRMEVVKNKKLYVLAMVVFILFLPQILLGIEVRHIIDGLLVNESDRRVWVGFLDENFRMHRSYSWIIVGGSVGMFLLSKQSKTLALTKASKDLLLLEGLIMLAGVGMTTFNFPFFLQSIHMLLATAIFGMLFYLILRLRYS